MRVRLAQVYPYRMRTGREVFQRVRYEWPVYEKGVLLGHGKEVVYRFRCDPRTRCWCRDPEWQAGYDPRCPRGWHWEKPPGADGYLYRLPEVGLAIKLGADVFWTEGEKDADALTAAGECATSHHGGAGKVNVIQAARLIGAKRVILCMDSDGGAPEKLRGPGAWDVWRRHELLIQAGLRSDQVVIVRTRAGKDVADHLAAGLSVSKLKVVDKDRVQRAAMLSRPPRRRTQGLWAAYRGGV